MACTWVTEAIRNVIIAVKSIYKHYVKRVCKPLVHLRSQVPDVICCVCCMQPQIGSAQHKQGPVKANLSNTHLQFHIFAFAQRHRAARQNTGSLMPCSMHTYAEYNILRQLL